MVRGGGVSTRIVEKNLKHILTLINNFEAILPLRFISATNSFFKIKFYWKITTVSDEPSLSCTHFPDHFVTFADLFIK